MSFFSLPSPVGKTHPVNRVWDNSIGYTWSTSKTEQNEHMNIQRRATDRGLVTTVEGEW